jgi:hypothetical protein
MNVTHALIATAGLLAGLLIASLFVSPRPEPNQTYAEHVSDLLASDTIERTTEAFAASLQASGPPGHERWYVGYADQLRECVREDMTVWLGSRDPRLSTRITDKAVPALVLSFIEQCRERQRKAIAGR